MKQTDDRQTAKRLNRVALRYQALYVNVQPSDDYEATAEAMAFVRRLRDNGYSVNEQLLHALSAVDAVALADMTEVVDDVMGVQLNWMPLVKGWQVPTGETRADHLITLFANLFDGQVDIPGTRLPCGHLIPDGTFPLERYNGCPFCGRPFRTASYVHHGQGSRLKELRLMGRDDLRHVLRSLLTSTVPLDATQRDSLALLLHVFGLPDDAEGAMKETAMVAAKMLVDNGRGSEAGALMRSPADVLRYLCYEKTGRPQVLEPRTLIAHAARLNRHLWPPADESVEAEELMRRHLRLRYDRPACRRVALWLNDLPMSAADAAEVMHPKRRMWVRFIRALRLPEYARRRGFERLAALLDVFYRGDYPRWQGEVDVLMRDGDAEAVLGKLMQRPGLFARCLFSSVLRLGATPTLKAFDSVADRLPARLLVSLANTAEAYFDVRQQRLARPLTGGIHALEPHRLLQRYSEAERQTMVRCVADLLVDSMRRRFAAAAAGRQGKGTIYIDPQLFDIPVAVGDRSSTIQDTSCALMGQRFAVDGDAVRLFLQWGKGLPAQPLDMDLSCRIAFADGRVEDCAYYNLTCTGARHSGDIRSVPDQFGTAEYVELSLPDLAAGGARYVTFTCNAYSNGALSPNLVVGWMSSSYPMTISEADGVAYDPSCVQHAVRISEGNLSKGLVFGVLDVARREVVWLEMPFTAQTLHSLNLSVVESLLRRLREKLSVGQLLEMRAEAMGLTRVDDPGAADESYTTEWAMNAAEVARLLDVE